jgi:hypothetical protein
MPRNPENKRIEILLTPEQYDALKIYIQAEVMGDMKAEVKATEISEAIREIIAFAIPSFARARRLVRRGKYKRS